MLATMQDTLGFQEKFFSQRAYFQSDSNVFSLFSFYHFHWQISPPPSNARFFIIC